MPRSFKLTWQRGTGKRPGRWRKKYQGKVHYFPGGRGKTDREAYEAALDKWERLKYQIDAETPKRHQAVYERAIQQWETVLTWCRANDEQEMALTAVAKQARLRTGLGVAKPKPLPLEDTFDGQFERSIREPDLHRVTAEIGAVAEAVAAEWQPDACTPFGEAFVAARDKLAQLDLQCVPSVEPPVVLSSGLDMDTPDPLRTEKKIWQDRLDVMQRSAASVDQTLHTHAEMFLAGKKAAVDAGEISASRYSILHSYVTEFVEWCGRQTPVTEINGKTLSDYHLDVLKRREAKGWSSRTAKDRLDTVKSFIRWLWHISAIPMLPRNMDSRSGGLKIGNSSPVVVVFEKPEIKRLLKEAKERTQLFILLMLNCGMTQKDIADLKHSEVDWANGRIVRKRSKTRQHGNVPTVSYLLWPTTLKLLKQCSTNDKHELVLLNENGGPLWHEELQANGKLEKNDNIRTAFGRLQRKTGIKKPLKSLKKTSASLIRSDSRYASLESLFLGHAPQTMSDRHYTLPPQKLLDEAIQWLATEYGLTEAPEPSAQ